MSHTQGKAFTLIEIMVMIVIVAAVASIVTVSYLGWHRQTATSSTRSDIHHAMSALHAYKNFANKYPPNLAGTGFAGSPSVALTLFTDAPSIGVYQNLTNEQNAQLFLNTCNANIINTPNNTACSFQGSGGGAKIHVTGTESSNIIWPNPLASTDMVLNCDASEQTICDNVLNAIKLEFEAQGGTFPINVPNGNVPLPEPTLVPNGSASRYCIQAQSVDYSDVVYYALSDDKDIKTGQCPADPSLHYFQ